LVASLAHAQQVLASQPFSALLGAQLTVYSEDLVEMRLAIVDNLKQQYGFVHGGVLSFLADNTLTFAGGLRLGG
jgi:acyl-coenzyme A thioesterase PaaI-like protein